VTDQVTVTVEPSGSYRLRYPQYGWDFSGTVGPPIETLTRASRDAIGQYQEITVALADDALRQMAIRSYMHAPVVVFTKVVRGPTDNTVSFPSFALFPRLPYHLSFEGIFAHPTFESFGAGSPWLFFDDNKRAMILSPASRFLVSTNSWGTQQELQSGVERRIERLPKDYTNQVILVVGPTINGAFETWGRSLTLLHGKVRPANDADATLKYLGYWTDHGSSYYYNFEPELGCEGTFLALKDEFEQKRVKLGYLQLDSWFYPKGPSASWGNGTEGIYRYEADPALFPEGLKSFQERLGLPLMTHSRWVDEASPYRLQYQYSGDVITDMRYWDDRAAYLRDAGVITYEQDWLGSRAQTAPNLLDPPLFFDNMAAGAASGGLTIQYSMPLPRHVLQSVKYPNVTSIRTSEDRFTSGAWNVYNFRLASALGVWPWVDVFLSTETGNLLVATLSGGVVGVGDRLGEVNGENLLHAARPDGVLVKPDEPLVPTDDTYVADARGAREAFVSFARTGDRALYIFAHTMNRKGGRVQFVPAELGMPGPVYVYHYFSGTGMAHDGSKPYVETLDADRYGYWVVVPVVDGVALLGDLGHFATMGRPRIRSERVDGDLSVTVLLAEGEVSRVISGYASDHPVITATTGMVSDVQYESATGLFSARLTGEDGTVMARVGRLRIE
jgi:hypothetical protein